MSDEYLRKRRAMINWTISVEEYLKAVEKEIAEQKEFLK
jgi:hypothetical protein